MKVVTQQRHPNNWGRYATKSKKHEILVTYNNFPMCIVNVRFKQIKWMS